ncbi:MAG: AraC family transcriptional regulator [Acutalibacteraceae bacterium]
MSQGFYQPDLDIEYIEYTLPREEKYKNCYSETKHGYYQIIFALSGKFRVMSNERIVELNPGEFAIASKNDTLKYHRLSVKAESIIIHFHPSIFLKNETSEFLEAFDELPANTVFKPENFDNTICLDTLRLYKEALNNKYSRIYMITRLKSILCEIDIFYRKTNKIPVHDKKNIAIDMIEYVNQNFTKHITLETLRNRYYISDSSINRIFKTMSGMTFVRYINNIRIHNVKNLVMSKNIPIFKAAEMSGFSNYSTFYRAYKKEYNDAPKFTKVSAEKYHFPFDKV